MSMTSLRFLPLQIGVVVGVVVASASLPLPAAAQAQVPPEMRSEAMTLMRLCRSDYDRLCSGVTPDGGRILACLQSHAGALSRPCAQVMSRAQALKDRAAAAGVLPR
jgi:Cysteine rich repeat